jgi:hypothetical protein
MNFDRRSRAGTPATKPSVLNKKQFIQYEPHLVEELNSKKTKNQSVSGRLLTLLYKRLSFWSRYAKHQYEGRRYFWKSIEELSEEVSYSTKQVSRGLRALEELGMIIRRKLNKHNWKHTYYYYLPHSVHTADGEATEATTSTDRSTTSSSSRSAAGAFHKGHQGAPAVRERAFPPQPHSGAPEAAGAGTGASGGVEAFSTPAGTAGGAPIGAGGRAQALHPKRQEGRCRNVSSLSRENNPLLTNQLRQIVEKCFDYGKTGIKPLTGRGVGFAS